MVRLQAISLQLHHAALCHTLPIAALLGLYWYPGSLWLWIFYCNHNEGCILQKCYKPSCFRRIGTPSCCLLTGVICTLACSLKCYITRTERCMSLSNNITTDRRQSVKSRFYRFFLSANEWVVLVNQTTSKLCIKCHSSASMRRIGLTTSGHMGISIEQLCCWIVLFLWHGSPTSQATAINARYWNRWMPQTPCQLFACNEYHQYFWQFASFFQF